MSLVVVADLETPHEALLVRGMLRAHGIPAELAADGHPLPATITGRPSGTAVVVPADDAEDARALLAETGALPGGTEADAEAPVASPGPPAARRAPADAVGAARPPGGPSPPPSVPLAATRARRPAWVVAAMVALAVLIVWLLLQASGLAAAGGT
jgi:hypothetical protein